MTADVASLVLKVDSSQAATGAATLDGLTAAAARTTPAISALEKSTSATKATLTGMEKAAAPAVAQLTKMQAEATKAATSNNAVRSSMANLSFQLNDIASGLAMGQSPFTIMAQQGGQVFQIWQLNNNVFKQTASAIASVITPARLLAGGILLAGVGAYAAYSSWKTFALQLDDTARRANTTSSEMAKLQASASFKGIDGTEFAAGMARFSENVYLAKAGMGGLADVFRANGVVAKDFNSSLEKAADLVKNARDDQQRLVLLQQMGLPATMEWVRLLSGGSEGIRKAKEEAVAFGGAANDQMVAKAREFDEAWNKVSTNFGLKWRSVFVDVIGFFDRLDSKATAALIQMEKVLGGSGRSVPANILRSALNGTSSGTTLTQSMIDDFYKATGAGRGGPDAPGKATVDPNKAANDRAMLMQRIGLLGTLATVEQAGLAMELAIQQARASGVHITHAEAAALKRLAEFQAESTKLQRAATFGIFDAGRQAANATREIQTLIDDKTIRSAEDYAAAMVVIGKRIKEASDAAAIARSPFEQLTRYALDGMNATKQFDSFAVASFGNIENGLLSLANGTKTAKQAFADMATAILSDLQRMIIRMTVTAPLAQALGGAFGGMFGGGTVGMTAVPGAAGVLGANGPFITPTYHTGHGPGDPITQTRYVHPAYFENAPRFHSGIGPNERPAIIRKDESVLTPGQMQALGRGSNSGTVAITYAPNIVLPSNADNVTVDQLKTTLTIAQREFKASVPGIVRDAIGRGHI